MAIFRVQAVAKYIMGSPIKMRRVVNTVRGMKALAALDVLAVLPQKAAVPVLKTIKSAIGNAEENLKLDADGLKIAEIRIDEGPRLRRGRYGARGRFKPILKKLSHITVVLEGEEDDESEA